MNIFLWIIPTVLSLTISDGVKITVDRNFNKDRNNDRFTLGSSPTWIYKCNMDGTHKCACYFKGTFTSDAGNQAKCFNDIPACQPVVSYQNGMQLTLQSGSSNVKQVLFWNLKSDGTENGVWTDFNLLFSHQYTVKRGRNLIIQNLPRPSFDGQFFKIIGSNGECIPIKVHGSITYPFDFTTLFPSYITTLKPTTTPFSTTSTPISPTITKTTLSTVNTSTTAILTTPNNSSFPTPRARTKDGFSIDNGIVIALAVLSVIAVGLLVTCLIIYRKRRGNKEQKNQGSVKFNNDKAIYLSPTDNTMEYKRPHTPYNAHNQNIGNPMYIKKNANSCNFDNPHIYGHLEKPDNYYEGIPYYQNEAVRPKFSESYKFTKNTAPRRNENENSYEPAFEIHSDNVTGKGTPAIISQPGYAGLCEFRNTDDFYAGIDTESKIDESRTQPNIKSKGENPKIIRTQPEYAPLNTSAISRNIYADLNGNEQNNYTSLSIEAAREEYTSLDAVDDYTSLNNCKTQLEVYETLTEDEKKNGFTHSKYVGW